MNKYKTWLLLIMAVLAAIVLSMSCGGSAKILILGLDKSAYPIGMHKETLSITYLSPGNPPLARSYEFSRLFGDQAEYSFTESDLKEQFGIKGIGGDDSIRFQYDKLMGSRVVVVRDSAGTKRRLDSTEVPIQTLRSITCT